MRLYLLIALLLTLTACATSGDGGDAPLTLQPTRIRQLEDSVFEIVVKKRGEKNVRYAGKEKLPVKELPYAERKDKYYSIGTAFATGGGKLVTASHVLELDRLAIDRDFYVRDKRGKVYEIAQVVRLSQYRDLLEFTLKKSPPKLKPLRLQSRTVLGETVYTIGNANGEGIAVRVGQIASYTYEPIKGAWKDIRFSAPASPGNSGGPLVNTKGEVVGVVVRKNESENLNVAIPIAELARLPNKEAEFFVPSSEANWDFEKKRDWRFKTPLPSTPAKLAVVAEADRRKFHLRQWKGSIGKTHDLAFPFDPELQPYFATQKYSQNMQVLSWDEKEGFTAKPDEPEWDTVTSRGETVYALLNEDNFTLAQIDLAQNGRHKDYIDRPQLLLEAVFESFSFFREFGGRKIPLASYGPPVQRSQFVDPLGRTWLTAIWRTHYNQATFILNCLPSTTGFGCALDNIDTAEETLGLQEKFQTYYSAKVLMSYWGSVGQWKSFLALDQVWLPPVLRGIKVEATKGRVSFAGGDFRLNYAQPLSNAKSWLFVGVGYGAQKAIRPEIQNVRFDHGPDFEVSESFEAVIEPVAKNASGGSGKGYWADLMSGRGVFDGRSRVEAKEDYAQARRILGRRALTNGKRIVQTVSCKGPPKAPFTASIETTCAAIQKAVPSAPGAPATAIAH